MVNMAPSDNQGDAYLFLRRRIPSQKHQVVCLYRSYSRQKSRGLSPLLACHMWFTAPDVLFSFSHSHRNLNMTTEADLATAADPRTRRPKTVMYAELMKPDEDWRNLPDTAERRKIQNRLAQRAYREMIPICLRFLTLVAIMHTISELTG